MKYINLKNNERLGKLQDIENFTELNQILKVFHEKKEIKKNINNKKTAKINKI